jgi:hypothetical protein|tara:strand:- start:87 stop:611 length:525 start_codon:yes stop_codon:yes gene_type:complete
MKKFLALIVIGLIGYFGYTHLSADNVVQSEPSVDGGALFTLTVINASDSTFRWEQSYGMGGPASGVLAAGDTVHLSSNETESDRINIYPNPPTSLGDKANPANGNFSMQYGWDGHIARIYCDNVCNKGYPTEKVHYEGTNWKYDTKWLKPSGVQTNATNTVTITTEPWTPPVVE